MGNLVKWEMSLPMAGDWNRVGFKVPSNPSHSLLHMGQVAANSSQAGQIKFKDTQQDLPAFRVTGIHRKLKLNVDEKEMTSQEGNHKQHPGEAVMTW